MNNAHTFAKQNLITIAQSIRSQSVRNLVLQELNSIPSDMVLLPEASTVHSSDTRIAFTLPPFRRGEVNNNRWLYQGLIGDYTIMLRHQGMSYLFDSTKFPTLNLTMDIFGFHYSAVGEESYATGELVRDTTPITPKELAVLINRCGIADSALSRTRINNLVKRLEHENPGVTISIPTYTAHSVLGCRLNQGPGTHNAYATLVRLRCVDVNIPDVLGLWSNTGEVYPLIPGEKYNLRNNGIGEVGYPSSWVSWHYRDVDMSEGSAAVETLKVCREALNCDSWSERLKVLLGEKVSGEVPSPFSQITTALAQGLNPTRVRGAAGFEKSDALWCYNTSIDKHLIKIEELQLVVEVDCLKETYRTIDATTGQGVGIWDSYSPQWVAKVMKTIIEQNKSNKDTK